MTSRRTGESPAAAPRPPPLTALSAPASPWRPTHRYTSSGRNGWTQTQTQRTTDTRTSHKGGRGPQTLTGPDPIAPRQRGPPHTGERMPRPEDHAISLNSPPRDAEVGGWASRDRRGPARADDARRQPLGRKKAGESGSRIIPILPQLISDLPEIHMHACQRQHRRGYPPALRRPRAAPSWARPHSW